MVEAFIDPQVYQEIGCFKLPRELGFGKVKAPFMYRALYRQGQWEQGGLLPYTPITLDPFAKVLHYSSEVFEGMKAHQVNQPQPVLFRPHMNWHRFNSSARRLCMPAIPKEKFLEGVGLVTAFSQACIPSKTEQSLYIRPFMIGTEANLSVNQSQEFSFYVIASPSDAYHCFDMKVLIERKNFRASLGGTGAVKTGGNYAAAFFSNAHCHQLGCHQSLWLDSKTGQNIEELSAMNIFAVIDGQLHTPRLTDSILPGITRDSLISLAKEMSISVIERDIPINELLRDITAECCTELFACGTAAIVAPITSVHEADGMFYKLPGENLLANQLRSKLIDIQEGRVVDQYGWCYEIPQAFYPNNTISATSVQ